MFNSVDGQNKLVEITFSNAFINNSNNLFL